MEIILGRTTNDEKALNKTYTTIKKFDAMLKDPCDVVDPVFFVTSVGDIPTLASANYMYVPAFGRYYFAKLETGRNSTMTIRGHCDVLMSARNQLRNKQCLVLRQEYVWSPYIIDTELLTRVERNISYKKIGNIGSPSGSYIALTVCGGKNIGTT